MSMSILALIADVTSRLGLFIAQSRYSALALINPMALRKADQAYTGRPTGLFFASNTQRAKYKAELPLDTTTTPPLPVKMTPFYLNHLGV